MRELTGSDEGVDVAFEAAGNERALDAGIRSLKVRGTLLNVSVWSRPPKVDMNELVFKERQLLGSSCYFGDHPAVMEALRTIDLGAFITGVIPLEQLVEKGFEELLHNNEAHVKILVSPSGDMSL